MKTHDVTIGGTTYKTAVTLGACVTYADEFGGKVGEPYRGLLADDLLELYALCSDTVADKDGRRVPNPDYRDLQTQIEPLLRIVWAAAVGAGSTGQTWPEFLAEHMEAELNVFELRGAYDAVIRELGDGTIFRGAEGRVGAGEAD